MLKMRVKKVTDRTLVLEPAPGSYNENILSQITFVYTDNIPTSFFTEGTIYYLDWHSETMKAQRDNKINAIVEENKQLKAEIEELKKPKSKSKRHPWGDHGNINSACPPKPKLITPLITPEVGYAFLQPVDIITYLKPRDPQDDDNKNYDKQDDQKSLKQIDSPLSVEKKLAYLESARTQ